MLDILLCSLKSLNRKRLRTVLTVSGITVGVTLVVIVSIIGSMGKNAVNAELESLGISGLSVMTNSGAAMGEYGITFEELELIRNVGQVEMAMPLMLEYASTSLRGNQNNTLICGIDSGAKQAISLSLKHGRLIAGGDISAAAQVCIVDEALAAEAYGRDNITGKTIMINVRGVEEEFRIIGVAAAESGIVQGLSGIVPHMVYIPYSSLQYMTGRDTFDQVAVRVKPSADVSIAEQRILERLQRYNDTADYYRTDNLAVQREKLGNLLDIVTAVLTVISGISLVVSGFGIMTIMLVSVNERMREIGVKKAIGASNGRILCEFLMEAMIISLFGGISGIAFGGILAIVGSLISGMGISIQWTDFIYLIVFTLSVGTLFGVYPAIKASRLRPVDALRLE